MIQMKQDFSVKHTYRIQWYKLRLGHIRSPVKIGLMNSALLTQVFIMVYFVICTLPIYFELFEEVDSRMF